MLYHENKITTPQQKLRRLSGRALRVIRRHRDRHETVAAFEKTLVPKTEDFNKYYEQKITRESAAKSALEEGYAVTRNLRLANNGWIDLLKRDVSDFDADQYSSQSVVPDDVINAASGIIEFVRYYQEHAEEPLAYGNELVDSLSVLLQTTREKWEQAQDAMAGQQELKAVTRKAALKLHNELKALRSVLRRVLGPSHRDYQKLRVLRGRELALEDEEVTEVTEVTESDVPPPDDSIPFSEMPTQPGIQPFVASPQ